MSIENVREYFKKWNLENKILEFSASSATVALAAEALQCEEKRIAKTLAFSVNDKAVLVVTAGDAKIDNAKYKAAFQKKTKMLSSDELSEKIGHQAGGVCPFGIKEGVEVYLDESLKRFETVFPACGSANSAIELSIPCLEKYSASNGWVDICKGW
ncbi:MAG: YbaK/EbsC family protein [Sporomusaceae bacterium]|nr:YbaK/EbsC family protein [Sporomusaceae bacterium]